MLELIFVSLGLSCVAGALSLVAGKQPPRRPTFTAL